MKKILKSYIVIIVVVILSAIYLTVSMLIFGRSSNELIDKTVTTYLSDNADAVAAMFKTKLEDQLVMLESQARYFKDIDLSDYNAMKNRILETKGIGDFKNIGVANTTGATINYNGKSSGNIMLTDYFKAAMSGSESISQKTYIDEDGDEVLVLAVPINVDGNITGVVFGTFTKSTLNILIDTANFGDSSANVLLDEDGGIIAFSQNSAFIDDDDTNLYEFIGSVPENLHDSLITFRNKNRDMLAAITPVGVHDWNFAILMDENIITDVSGTIERYVIYIVIAVAVVFLLLLGSILLLMRNLNAEKKDRARIDAELGVATKIQSDMLPTDFPETDHIRLYASMEPAKEVGGDFYDFFYTDKDHLALVMADVAGKGVPAALFMVVAKAVLRNQLNAGGSPSKILRIVNNILCANNSAGLFVTVWLGILDIRTGVVQYVNAGHEYPIVGRKDKGFELITGDNCPPLAAMEGMEFIDETIILEPGDTLFLYTDGVPEAKNQSGERFGIDAIITGLNQKIDSSAAEQISAIKLSIDNFVGGIDPFDDITMMGVNYLGHQI